MDKKFIFMFNYFYLIVVIFKRYYDVIGWYKEVCCFEIFMDNEMDIKLRIELEKRICNWIL